jgi:hypothetical protein
MNELERRTQVLFGHGASLKVAEELLAYTQAPDYGPIMLPAQIPLPAELHITSWRAYADEAAEASVFPVLQKRLPQLCFPIRAGMSQSAAYEAATRRGQKPAGAEAGGLRLQHPDRVGLRLHQTLAGVIPVLLPCGRPDFVALVQAFAKRNEPETIPDSMGAALITGYRNWDRIRQLRREWDTSHEYLPAFAEVYWQQELRQHILPHKSLYQDTFMILSDGDYSGIPAASLGLPDEQWRQDSLLIRLEHECMHYLMRRLLPARPSLIMEEIVADWRGMVATWGRFDAGRFMRFMGLEDFPHYRTGGRLDVYRGVPPLSDDAFSILQSLLREAAVNLEQFYNQAIERWASAEAQTRLALALSCLTLEELAATQSHDYIEEVLRTIHQEHL